jgi:hypothetical protein
MPLPPLLYLNGKFFYKFILPNTYGLPAQRFVLRMQILDYQTLINVYDVHES